MTTVFSFPCHSEYYIKGKEDVSIWEQMKNAADYQRYWSDNSVSITVTIRENEKNEVATVLERYEDALKCVSFLYLSQNVYQLAPYEKIDKETYENMKKSIKPIDFKSINLYKPYTLDTMRENNERFCDGDHCEIPSKLGDPQLPEDIV
jgi:ribonucleoside-diphosphate reductase alpha chain/ribonucleoside-triphosphate reductase